MTTLNDLRKDLKSFSDSQKAKNLQRFFKTKKGEYGEGDVFIGVSVPDQRKVAKKYKDLPLEKIEKLLHSKIHEERLVSLLILVEGFKKGNKKERETIYKLYLKNTKYINNWDLVDLTAGKIVGEYLFDKDRNILKKLAKSPNLWEKRISIIATSYFIWKGQFQDTLEISTILLEDDHDLIHKAVGWMLREVGKRDRAVEEKFLKKHYKKMPRTMLRYAIEKFPESLRQKYLKGKI